jgi:hypothetical protein
MVERTSDSMEQALECVAETNGDLLRLKKGEIEGSHVISSDTDPEGMRLVGALGEMLYEQIKSTFGLRKMLLVSDGEDFKLVMFPSEEGFIVWKTNLDLARIVSAVGPNQNNPKGNKSK